MQRTWLVIFVAAVLACGVAIRGAERAPDAGGVAVADAAGQRRDAMLHEMVKKPYPPDGAWHYEDFALAAYWLNERLGEADQAILTVLEKEFPKFSSGEDNSFHWHAYLLQRIYFLFHRQSRFFPGRMSAQAEAAIAEMLWRWSGPSCRREMTLPERDFWYWGSENHHAQAWASFWGAAQILSGRPEYRQRRYGDGSTPVEMAAAFNEYFKRYARHRAETGLLVECNSDYNKYTLGGWYNMADFADDPVLRTRMRMLLDLYWTDWAIEQLDGVRGGSRHRCYYGENSTTGTSGGGMSWYHFGLGTPGSKHPGHICAATTFYRPAALVTELALDTPGRGVYAYRSRRPGLKQSHSEGQPVANFVADPQHPFHVPQGINALASDGGSLARYSWCTPDFVLGTSMVEARPFDAWTAISSQNRWEGVIFAGDPHARIFVQTLLPKRGSVYNAYWTVQNKGVLIAQRLKTAKSAQGNRVWFDRALKRSERDGWVFAEAPRAFAAVRVVEGGTAWEPDSVGQHRSNSGRTDQGMWLKCENEFAPVIIEVVRKSDFADLAAFQAAVLANRCEWRARRLDYTSKFYGATLTLFGDYSRAPLVDGQPVDYRPKKVYDSPFLESDFGSGLITIRKGDKRLVLDFTTP